MRYSFTLVAFLILGTPLRAQDTVTIPKARLEELERKEAELQRLKGIPAPTNTPSTAPAAPVEPPLVKPTLAPAAPPAKAPAQPAKAAAVPPLASLPPFKEGDVVEAVDLAGHYRAGAAEADARYRKKKFTVRGEIIGFEKPLLTSNYKIVLKTGDLQARVVCDLLPPENATAVLTINHGLELVAQVQKVRVPMAKVGDIVLVTGQCHGWHGQDVRIIGRQFTVAQ